MLGPVTPPIRAAWDAASSRKGVTSPFFLHTQNRTAFCKKKKKRALIPLARDPGDTVNLHPKAKGNLHPSTLALPDVDTTSLHHWWRLRSA